jgi:hypothetical protein
LFETIIDSIIAKAGVLDGISCRRRCWANGPTAAQAAGGRQALVEETGNCRENPGDAILAARWGGPKPPKKPFSKPDVLPAAHQPDVLGLRGSSFTTHPPGAFDVICGPVQVIPSAFPDLLT